MSDSRFDRLRQPLRLFVRQVTAAIYATMGFGLTSAFVRDDAFASLAWESAWVAAAAGILTWLTEGPAWTVSLVGACVATFDAVIVLFFAGEADADLLLSLAVRAAVLSGVGAGVSWGLRKRRKSARIAAPSDSVPPAP